MTWPYVNRPLIFPTVAIYNMQKISEKNEKKT